MHMYIFKICWRLSRKNLMVWANLSPQCIRVKVKILRSSTPRFNTNFTIVFTLLNNWQLTTTILKTPCWGRTVLFTSIWGRTNSLHHHLTWHTWNLATAAWFWVVLVLASSPSRALEREYLGVVLPQQHYLGAYEIEPWEQLLQVILQRGSRDQRASTGDEGVDHQAPRSYAYALLNVSLLNKSIHRSLLIQK